MQNTLLAVILRFFHSSDIFWQTVPGKTLPRFAYFHQLISILFRPQLQSRRQSHTRHNACSSTWQRKLETRFYVSRKASLCQMKQNDTFVPGEGDRA